jgi:hypothetical protein
MNATTRWRKSLACFDSGKSMQFSLQRLALGGG